ncbi:hypothetical protein PPYR_07608 [Photinus pyralis]|uniref:Uncharacterized protein n=1 Tax=Photinus pyralis TaxID=7054 RepID=A0A1Y1KET8_PHOPY|nr:leucine-rich repeat protein SHOC-2-like [Photinus pyralis]KAB0799728.1 hypothetical protein PPYR_07608 [Photinus pyralis]
MDLALLISEAVLIDGDKVKVKACTNGDDLVINEHSLQFNLHSSIFPSLIDVSSLVSLNLSACKLTFLPDDLKNLSLTELDLSKNAFREVPKCIYDGLKVLQVLNFSHNKLSWFDAPRCLIKLRVLKINHNDFMDIPPWILKVFALNLEELDYSHNCIISLKACRFYLTPMHCLNKLELRNCEMRSDDFKYLKTIRTLKHLDIGNDESASTMNSFVSNDLLQLFISPHWAKNLTVLSLNYLYISDLPAEISNLPALEELHLRNNELLWLPEAFLIPTLQLLDLSFNRVAILPKNLSGMPKLRILRLEANGLETLPVMPSHLEELDLYNNKLETYCNTQGDLRKLDLEMNYFDTSTLGDFERYLEMKTAIRGGGDCFRNDGFHRIPEPEDEESDTDSEIDSYCDNDEVRSAGDGCVEECWDDEQWGEGAKFSGDDGVTLSDVEFNGYQEDPPKPKVQGARVVLPDWVYCDVPSEE